MTPRWTRALVFVRASEGGTEWTQSLYVALHTSALIEEGRKAAQGWIEGLVRLHRRQIDEARIERLEYETDEGAWNTIDINVPVANSITPTRGST